MALLAHVFHFAPSEIDALDPADLQRWLAAAEWIQQELGRAAEKGRGR